ncbi:Dhp1p-interacting protein Din1 [Schizosaccharomyces cryophilus OY26]|uniref:Decapping nuclease n=1 Tax=Schizosaccharomyces cryophilus (strain OY26 / ATCC MYA-4695 / CBS 11777 / NBRC 106824 / NRRL Y48691) TaxID=653667 RepID=S9X8P6_SCHCR|nr:Dhp1p-interacting protein Din1 [Schizosaccharomyces cryophilus OY26]EPY50201.1 Dhp1p-interacting protein Din1 [Schizosaccharomyces cryophilus OY26]
MHYEFAFYQVRPSSTPSVSEPHEIASYSLSEDHTFHLDERQLKYYYPPLPYSDLNSGYPDKYHPPKAGAYPISTAKDILEKKHINAKAELFTWRGLITKIMCAPLYPKSQWELKLRMEPDSGTIFMEEGESSEKPYENQDRMCYWGYKFEVISTLPTIWDACSRSVIEGRDNQPVIPDEQYCSIVKYHIGRTRLILAGEVDCVWDAKPGVTPDSDLDGKVDSHVEQSEALSPREESLPDPKRRKLEETHDSSDPSPTLENPSPHYCELKTSKKQPLDHVGMRRKLLKFWAQSYLLGIGRIVIGFRNDDGILTEIKELPTRQIPNLLRPYAKPQDWTANRLLVVLEQELDWLKKCVQKHPPNTKFTLQYSGNGKLVLRVHPHN